MTITTYKDDEEYLSNGYVITFTDYDYYGMKKYYNIDYNNNLESQFKSIKIPNDFEIRFDRNPVPITESQTQFNKPVLKMYIQQKSAGPTLTNAPSSMQYSEVTDDSIVSKTELSTQSYYELLDSIVSEGNVLQTTTEFLPHFHVNVGNLDYSSASLIF